ncbi:SCO2322 family protein [Streptomyces sp. NPDC051211]|uniref:SCO2322 family protein n=1 Tax=Streptomyces sp. NPDC051211 TaxID=3154643 RepID=UPI00344F8853
MTRRHLAAPALLVALLLGVLLSSPALAAGYRYWSFWDGGTGGRWTYATQGPSLVRPADGEVQGFRFAVSKDDSVQGTQPRVAADFAAVCGTTPAVPGKKRVAVVVDFGVPADAPAGETPPQDAPRTACAQVPPEATAAEALAAVAKPLRYNASALLCAISGYPRQGCGEQLSDSAPNPSASAPSPSTPPQSSPSPSDSGPSVGLLAGIAAVLALAAAALWQSRRRPR